MITIRFPYLEISRPLDIPCSVIWDVLTDTGRWPQWGPSVAAVRCFPQRIGKGSTGRVKTILGFWVPFTVTDWDEGRSWSWRVSGLPATGHLVEALAPGRCRLAFRVPLWAWPYVLVCKVAMDRIARIAGRRRGQSVHHE